MSNLHSNVQKFLVERLHKQTKDPGEICAPEPPELSNYDRVPPRMFWYSIMLLQEIYNQILATKGDLKRVSDDTLLEQLQGYATKGNVRDSAIFNALVETLCDTER